jgi:hypothetical protein
MKEIGQTYLKAYENLVKIQETIDLEETHPAKI